MTGGGIMTKDHINNKLYLFMYTIREYQRFSNGLSSHELTDDYNEETYVQINM